MRIGLLGIMPDQQKDDVTWIRPSLFEQCAEKYQIVSDCIEQNVKKRGEKYLSVPYTSESVQENKDRYASYWERAIYYNVTGRTLQGLSGQIYSRPPKVKAPEELAKFLADATGRNVSFEQASKDLSNYVVAYGRAGVWVDFPLLEEGTGVSRADVKSGKIKPILTVFGPTNIINWREEFIDNRMRRTLVVTVENEDTNSQFAVEQNKIYREMRLTNGAYTLQIWRARGEGGQLELVKATYTPVRGDGTPFTEIPFEFCGSVNNDAEIDPAPLFDLATLNIGHYRNSADYEEACFIVGQPTLVLSGLDETWVSDVMKGQPILLGSRRAIPLPVGGNAVLLQAAPNMLPKEAMDQKQAQMVAMGAKLVENRQVRRTASEAGLANASEASILSQCAKNASAALTRAMVWAAEFMNASTDGIQFELNTDFALNTLSQEERIALIADFQAGGISFGEYRDQLRRGGLATMPDEEVEAEMKKRQAEKDAAEIAKAKEMAPPAPSNVGA